MVGLFINVHIPILVPNARLLLVLVAFSVALQLATNN